MSRSRKSYSNMNADELRSATREFEHELPVGSDGLPGRSLNTSERARWQKVRTGMGRPRMGKEIKKVVVSIEADLLSKTDRFAKQNGLSRSGMVSAGLRKLMAG